jgi:hypothetical protein
MGFTSLTIIGSVGVTAEADRGNRYTKAHSWKWERTVRFSETIQVFPTISTSNFTPDEITSCWWTEQEFNDRRVAVRALLLKHVPKLPTPTRNQIIEILHEMHEGTWEDVICESDDCLVETRERFLDWTAKASRLRGLEKQIVAVSASRRQWGSYQRSDLACAAREVVFRMETDSSFAWDEIASVYSSRSRVAVVFAHNLGMADEQFRI